MSTALAACARGPGGAGVQIGYQKDGLLLLSKARGTLASRLAAKGVGGVTWAEFASGPPLIEAMRAGAVDLGGVGDTPPIFAQAAGAQLLYVGAQPVSGDYIALIVPPASTLRTVADLKGQRLAFVKGSSAHLLVAKLFAQAGLRFTDVNAIHLSPADAASAFVSGALDAWAVWDPYLAMAEARPGVRRLADGREVSPTYGFYLASRAYADRAPAQLAAVLAALTEDAAWANSHTSDVVSLLQRETGLPRAIAAITLRRGPYAMTPITAPVIAAQQAAADLLTRLGELPSSVDIRAAVWPGAMG